MFENKLLLQPRAITVTRQFFFYYTSTATLWCCLSTEESSGIYTDSWRSRSNAL